MIYKKKINSKILNDKRNYALITKKDDRFKYFEELNMYIINLLNQLWKNPKIVYIILSNSDIKDIKNNLADFFVNCFFENILSSNCIENNLLYLITLLLKDEVNNLLSKENPEIFLNCTRCGYLLEKLIEKKELKIYFSRILYDVFEKLKNEFSRKLLNFEAEKLNKSILKKIEGEPKNGITENNKENNLNSKDISNSIIIEKDIDNNKEILFNTKYLKALNENDLNKFLIDIQKLKEDNNIKHYIININNNIKQNPNLYGTTFFSKEINNKNKHALNLYKEYFFKIFEFIDIILDNLLNNINIIPYPIKCICKIISKLLEIKFPQIKNYEKYAFISKFFFYNLLSPFLTNPGFIGLMKEFIITKVQENNLSILDEIIKKFVLGKLFKDDKIEGNFSPFNWMIIEKMPKLFEFFDIINDVNLPNFIENEISENSNNEYKYDYFEENKDEIITHISICYNIDNIYSLIHNIKNCQNKIFNENINKDIEILIKKLLIEENIAKLDNLKDKQQPEIIKEEIPEEIMSLRSDSSSIIIQKPKDNFISTKSDKENEIFKYFLITNLIINDKYKSLNDEQEKLSYNIMNDKNDKNIILEIDENKKIMNKVKNLLSPILLNYKILNKYYFNEKSLSNIFELFNIIKENMKISNILINKSIPSEWYIDSLLELIKILPKELINNNYEELLKQIENDFKESINSINFQQICLIKDKLQNAINLKDYYDSVINILFDIKLSFKANYIIKKSIIPMEIKYKKKKCHINFKPIKEEYIKNKNDNNINNNPEVKIIFCKTIEDFINNFPDISNKFQEKKIDPFILLQKTKFSDRMNNYLKIIQKFIRNEKIAKNEIESNLMLMKIHDYIMEKLYLKILPLVPQPMDNMIYFNCKKINWIEPKHLIKGNKDMNFSNFISDISKLIEILDKQKCPGKKFFYLEEIFKTIYNLKVFNGDKSQGVDSEIAFLHYGIIKAKPKKLYSDCQYMKIFLGKKKGKREDNHLTQLLVLSSQICKLNHTYLMNVSESEYNEKCKNNVLNFV